MPAVKNGYFRVLALGIVTALPLGCSSQTSPNENNEAGRGATFGGASSGGFEAGGSLGISGVSASGGGVTGGTIAGGAPTGGSSSGVSGASGSFAGGGVGSSGPDGGGRTSAGGYVNGGSVGIADMGGASNAAGSGPGGGVHPTDAVQFKGHWYRHTNATISGAAAQKICSGLGGQLACIETQEEDKFLLTLAGATRPWLGMNNLENVNQYVWINGSPVTYTHWQANQPDNPENERWVKMVEDGSWDDGNIETSYICEWVM